LTLNLLILLNYRCFFVQINSVRVTFDDVNVEFIYDYRFKSQRMMISYVQQRSPSIYR